MKALKWLLILVIGLPILVFAVAAVLLATTDLNRFKPDIEALASEQLGRTLTIKGDIGHSLFPWLSISLGEIELANAEGFGDQPFASIDSAEASLKVLPLLSGKITVGEIALIGATVDAQVAADGTDNFPVVASGDAPADTETSSGSTELPDIAIDGVRLVNADIRYRDASADLDAHATDINLSIGNVSAGETSQIDGGLALSLQPAGLDATVTLAAALTPDFGAMQFALSDLNLEIDAAGSAIPGGSRSLTLTGAAEADLNAGTAALNAFNVESGNAVATLDVAVTGLNDALAVKGDFNIPTMDLGALLESLDLSAGPMQREDALSAFALNAALSYTGDSAALDALTITLDDTTLKGEATVSDLEAALPAVVFALDVDSINVDHYSPPLTDETADATDSAQTDNAATAEDIEIPLPLDLLRELKLDGTAQVASLTAANLSMQDIAVALKAAGGKVAVSSLKGALYEGDIDASLALDVTTDTPSYRATASLKGVQAQPLLTDFAEFDKLLGGGLINLDINTAGSSVNALTSALNGNMSFSFLDGAIDGINIAAELRKVLAAIGQADGENVEETQRTDFAKFSASADITDGVVRNTDLDLRSPLLRLAGSGDVDLPGERVDYVLQPALVSSLEGQGGDTGEELGGLQFDLPIAGTFDELANDPVGTLRRSLSDGLKGAAQAELDAKKAELKAAAEAKEAELKAAAKAKEAELKAAAKAKEEEAKAKLKEKADEKLDEAKDKLKDKLKDLL